MKAGCQVAESRQQREREGDGGNICRENGHQAGIAFGPIVGNQAHHQQKERGQDDTGIGQSLHDLCSFVVKEWTRDICKGQADTGLADSPLVGF